MVMITYFNISNMKKYTLYVFIYFLGIFIWWVCLNFFLYSLPINYIEDMTPNTLGFSNRVNSSQEYRDFCNENRTFSLCQKIYNGTFHSHFYWECKAIEKNDPRFCDSSDSDIAKIFCKNNLVVLNAILSHDKDICSKKLIENKVVLWDKKLGHTEKSNIEFCREASDLFKNPTDENIKEFTLDFFSEMRFYPRVNWIIRQNPSLCYEWVWIDDRIKCLIYTRWVDCERFKDEQYIYELIDWTNHFFDM